MQRKEKTRMRLVVTSSQKSTAARVSLKTGSRTAWQLWLAFLFELKTAMVFVLISR
jgi:hypothetical protein